ncbi:hypothetical protein AOLI_G00101280 [Acnodon oligacanthus]
MVAWVQSYHPESQKDATSLAEAHLVAYTVAAKGENAKCQMIGSPEYPVLSKDGDVIIGGAFSIHSNISLETMSFTEKPQGLTCSRTIPSDYYQSRALAQLVKYFGWTWVGAVRSDNDYGNNGMATFMEAARKEGVCVEYSEAILRTNSKESIAKVVEVIRQGTAKVLVAFLAQSEMDVLLEEALAQNMTGLQWIGSESWITARYLATEKTSKVISGAIGVTINNFKIPGLKDFLVKVHPSQIPSSALLREFWETTFGCQFTPKDENEKLCTGFENLKEINNAFTDVSELRISNNVYKAVYAIAHALQNTLACPANDPIENMTWTKKDALLSSQSVNFTMPTGESVSFDSNGDPTARYELVNWQKNPAGDIAFITVGHYDASLPSDEQFVMKPVSIVWAGNSDMVLHSLQSVNFTMPTGESVYFNSNGDPTARYELVNWQKNPAGDIAFITVGHYDASLPSDEQFVMKPVSIVWAGNSDMISHFATCACLSNRKEYPSFFRTIPSDYYQSRALAQLVKYFGWTWVGAVRSDNDYGNNGMATFMEAARKEGVCVEYSEAILRTNSKESIAKVVEVIKQGTAKVLVAFLAQSEMDVLLEEALAQNMTGLQWIGSESWITARYLATERTSKVISGAIGFTINKSKIPGLKDFLVKVHPSQSPSSALLREFWETTFGCQFTPKDENEKLCTGFENLKEINNTFTDVSELRISNNVYKAVYAIAHALQNTLSKLARCKVDDPTENMTCTQKDALLSSQSVNFTMPTGESVYFNSNGDPTARYELVNWQKNPAGDIAFITVGHYDASLPSAEQFVMKPVSIVWAGNSDMVDGNDLDILIKELYYQNVTGFQWVGSEGWITYGYLANAINYAVVGGAVGFAVPNAHIPGLKEFIASSRPYMTPGNTGLVELWENVFDCNLRLQSHNGAKSCTGEESLETAHTRFTDVTDASLLNNIYKAVYAVAYAVDGLLACVEGKGPFPNGSCANKGRIEPWQVELSTVFLYLCHCHLFQ